MAVFFRLEYLQVERLAEHAGHSADAGQRSLESRSRAGFYRDDEGQVVLAVAGLLEDGMDVDSLLGERQGDLGDDARLVADYEADRMAQQKFTADCGFLAGQIDGARAVRDADDIGDNGDGGGMTSCPVSGEDNVTSVVAADEDGVLGAARPRERRGLRDKHGADAGENVATTQLGPRDLPDGAVELASVGKIDGVDLANRPARDFIRIDVGAQGEARQNHQLG